MAQTVIGLFRNSTEAYKAYEVLKENGFDENNVDVSTNYGSYERSHDSEDRSSKIGEFFKSLFGNDDDDRDNYSRAAQNNSIVTVHAQTRDEAEDAADILDDCGAINVNDKEAKTSDTNYGTSYQRETGDNTIRNEDRTKETSIPVIEEKVSVGKREVQKGGVRVRSRIIEKPVAETLRLREEHVHVERNPVNREATEADLKNFQEGTMEFNEFGEEVIVSKKARVVEEVKVGVDVQERNETVNETERKTEVVVEDLSK